MFNYLLMIYRDQGPKKNDLPFYRSKIEQTVKARVGPPERRCPVKVGKQNKWPAFQLKERFNSIEKMR
jgi:hypothetical protein